MEGPSVAELDRVELERVLERRIAERTWGRVRQLRVEMTPDRVIVHGYTFWYYVKQLALQVVLDTFRAGDSVTIEMDIQVNAVVPSDTRP